MTTRLTNTRTEGPGDAPRPRVWKAELLEAKLRRSSAGSEMADLLGFLGPEAVSLVKESRRVGATWNRYHGPRFIRDVVASGFEGDTVIPREMDGVTLEDLLLHMADALQRYGSPEMRHAIARWSLPVLRWARECDSLQDLFERLERLNGEVPA
jgi:hypothetical protein